ncbi:hypothetical protein LB557_02050 [Mesorhizobium sp. BR115XR7A]|uniref:hypothetical protein n=1 Tax=Mesorhizobium sp. BR115XR7A TaxID=2876645 RepID=UPI001CCE8268|nr:hypothetical protein [Mesorhizobium sp. BR115XR7A]MBZ9904790.1 hypothetical protein [Mesorhizobium sp. BR115XR7A]MBZ9933027.1 hypothetical protein [Mesorhizobium sp. BR1-1-5]
MQTASADGSIAANDNPRFRGGYPALNWLANQDRRAARAVLVEVGNSRHQTHSAGAPAANVGDDIEVHDVPAEELSSTTMAEPTQDGPDEIWPEMLHEIKPSVHALLRSAGGVAWPWCGRRRKKDGKEIWSGEPWQYFYCLLPLFGDEQTTLLGGLTFYTEPKACRESEGGMLVTYTDATDNAHRPEYKASKPRGGKRPRRTKAAAEEYVRGRAAISSPLRVEGYQQPLSDEPTLIPMFTPQLRREPGKGLDIYGQVDRLGRYGVAEARAEIAKCMDVAPPATRCPTVIAKGAWFMGGISSSKETASVPAPNWQVPEAKPLSPALEEAASRGDLADIGRALGDKTTRQDRLGKRVLLAEARALVAANDNTLKKVAA